MAHSFGSSKPQAQGPSPLPSLAPMSPYGAGVNRHTDGVKTHPLQDTLAAVTVVLALVAIATCAFRGLHVVASWTGLAGIITGAVGQYLSVTTAERFAFVCAGVVAAVGLGIGLAHGGLY